MLGQWYKRNLSKYLHNSIKTAIKIVTIHDKYWILKMKDTLKIALHKNRTNNVQKTEPRDVGARDSPFLLRRFIPLVNPKLNTEEVVRLTTFKVAVRCSCEINFKWSAGGRVLRLLDVIEPEGARDDQSHISLSVSWNYLFAEPPVMLDLLDLFFFFPLRHVAVADVTNRTIPPG